MSATTLQRLLKHPHAAVFDKDPLAELVLRVSHAGGSSWVVAAGVLTVVAGGEEFTYQLAGYTVSTLANAMQADGLSVTRVNSQYGHLSALALVEGASDQWLSNGDHLRVFTSLLWALLQGYSREVDAAQEQIRQALLQMVIATAEGEWLDLWGTLYGVPRKPGEPDEDVRDRIPKEAFRVRVNGLAIEDAIKDITDEDIELREPWREIFRLDESKLSGNHHFADGYYSYFLVQPVARRGGVNWPGVLGVIHRNRAAGIEVYAPVTDFGPRYVVGEPPLEYIVDAATGSSRAIFVPATGEAPLGLMRLDDNEFTINHAVMAYQLRTYSNAEGLQTLQHIGLPINIAYASIELSGGVPLGDENAILSRGQERYLFDPEPVLSDSLAPSGYDAIGEVRRVERITLSVLASDVEFGEVEASNQRTNVYVGFASAYDGLNVWEGWWDARNWLGWRQVGSRRIDIPA